MEGQTPKFYPTRRHILLLAFAVLAVYVLLPQIGDFRSSWHLLIRPEAGATAVAVALGFATFAAAAGTYCFLAFKRLAYGRTLLIQLAATFVNRLLPAGIGALGANYLYLRHERHSPSQAGSIVAMNNLLGLTGHSLLVAAVLLAFPGPALAPSGRHTLDPLLLVKLMSAGIVVLVLLVLFFGRHKVSKTLAQVKGHLLSYRHRPLSLLSAQATSLVLTLCNVLCLFFCVQALGLQLPLGAVFLVFTLGLGAGSAVPTPGGLGGFEAGLAAGFVAYGIDAAPALAVALLFRLISYWLPLFVGAIAFAVCQRRGLFEQP